jgi:hypothetical protein
MERFICVPPGLCAKSRILGSPGLEENPEFAQVQGFHRCARGASGLASVAFPKGGTEMKKALTVTAAVVLLVAIATAGALYGLSSLGRSYQTCGKVDSSELRQPADPDFAKKLERLARCEH